LQTSILGLKADHEQDWQKIKEKNWLVSSYEPQEVGYKSSPQCMNENWLVSYAMAYTRLFYNNPK
jgi:hypothetical protein